MPISDALARLFVVDSHTSIWSKVSAVGFVHFSSTAPGRPVAVRPDGASGSMFGRVMVGADGTVMPPVGPVYVAIADCSSSIW